MRKIRILSYYNISEKEVNEIKSIEERLNDEDCDIMIEAEQDICLLAFEIAEREGIDGEVYIEVDGVSIKTDEGYKDIFCFKQY